MTTMSFSKSAQWKTGLRTYFEYRDLGIVGATGSSGAARSAGILELQWLRFGLGSHAHARDAHT